MKIQFPKQMIIGGTAVAVNQLDRPVYQFYICPKCTEWDSNGENPKPYTFVAQPENRACPACGYEHTQPQNNAYVLGQYRTNKHVIDCWVSDDPGLKEHLEKSFIHETIEAINAINDLRLRHPKLTTLASAIWQAMVTDTTTSFQVGPFIVQKSGERKWETPFHTMLYDINEIHKLGLNEHQLNTCALSLYEAFSSGYDTSPDVSYAQAA